MKKHVVMVVLMSALAPVAVAQSGGMNGMDMKGMDMKGMEKSDAKATVHKATGIVTKVHAAKNRVTIRHEPVPSIKWPAMTMAFTVKDKALLERMPKGQKIDFEFVQQGRDYVVTAVK